MRRQPAASGDSLDRAVENIHQTADVFLVCVAAHRWLVDGNFVAAARYEFLQLRAHDRHESLRDSVSIRVDIIGHEPAAQRIRTGHAGLQNPSRRGQSLQPLELPIHTQTTRRAKLTHYLMPAALIVRRRTK